MLFRSVGCALALATYFSVDAIACAHGWCVRPAHSFIPRSLHPQLEDAHLTLAMYFDALQKGSDQLMYTWVLEFCTLAMILILVIFARRMRGALTTPFRVFVLVTCAMIVRYLLFPIPDDRALIPWYATIMMLAIALVHQLATPRKVTAP